MISVKVPCVEMKKKNLHHDIKMTSNTKTLLYLIIFVCIAFMMYKHMKNQNQALRELEPVRCTENGDIGYLNVNGELRQVDDNAILRSWMGADINDMSKLKRLDCTNIKKGSPLQMKDPPLIKNYDAVQCIGETPVLDYEAVDGTLKPNRIIAIFAKPEDIKHIDCTFLKKGAPIF
jgi:hypothetical protein